MSVPWPLAWYASVEVGMAHVRAFRGAGQREGKAAKAIGVIAFGFGFGRHAAEVS